MQQIVIETIKITGSVLTGVLTVVGYLKFKNGYGRTKLMSHETRRAFDSVKSNFKEIRVEKQSKEICEINIKNIDDRLDSIDRTQSTMAQDVKEILKGINKSG